MNHKHPHNHHHPTPPLRSVLSWPAWLRVAAVLPLVVALWWAVLWANEGNSLW